jgi:hypothetical protein
VKYKKGQELTSYCKQYHYGKKVIIRQLGYVPDDPSYFITLKGGEWPKDGGFVFERELHES